MGSCLMHPGEDCSPKPGRARKWVEFFIDNPVASVTLMRAIRKQVTQSQVSKKGDMRIPFEKFLKEQDFE